MSRSFKTQMPVYLDVIHAQALDRLAERMNLKTSQLMRRVLLEYIKAHDDAPKPTAGLTGTWEDDLVEGEYA
jgi:predicted transcriptional regulator